jgi:glycosyltransferase involved in cell wall biosynthesis
MNKIAVLIPAHNESKAIRNVVKSVLQYVEVVVVVDDGSSDGTAEKIADLPIKLILHETNQGKSQAMVSGFKVLQNLDVCGVLSIDADSQHRPEDIPNFLKLVSEQPDQLIIGARIKGIEAKPKKSLIGNKIADFFVSWAGGKILTDTQSGYKFYPMNFIKQFKFRKRYKSSFLLESELLIVASRKGHDFSLVPIQAVYSDDISPSHYRPWLDTLPIIAMIAWKIIKGGLYPVSLVRAIRYFWIVKSDR